MAMRGLTQIHPRERAKHGGCTLNLLGALSDSFKIHPKSEVNETR